MNGSGARDVSMQKFILERNIARYKEIIWAKNEQFINIDETQKNYIVNLLQLAEEKMAELLRCDENISKIDE